ncbi:MAG: helix-turn-helix domain-containing protein [bacterium]
MKVKKQESKKQFQHKLGKKIKKLRLKRDFSLRELGRLANCSGAYIGLIEKGKNMPNAFVLNNIASALNVPITHFFNQESKINLDEYDPIIENNDFQEYFELAKKAYFKNAPLQELKNAVDIIAKNND